MPPEITHDTQEQTSRPALVTPSSEPALRKHDDETILLNSATGARVTPAAHVHGANCGCGNPGTTTTPLGQANDMASLLGALGIDTDSLAAAKRQTQNTYGNLNVATAGSLTAEQAKTLGDRVETLAKNSLEQSREALAAAPEIARQQAQNILAASTGFTVTSHSRCPGCTGGSCSTCHSGIKTTETVLIRPQLLYPEQRQTFETPREIAVPGAAKTWSTSQHTTIPTPESLYGPSTNGKPWQGVEIKPATYTTTTWQSFNNTPPQFVPTPAETKLVGLTPSWTTSSAPVHSWASQTAQPHRTNLHTPTGVAHSTSREASKTTHQTSPDKISLTAKAPRADTTNRNKTAITERSMPLSTHTQQRRTAIAIPKVATPAAQNIPASHKNSRNSSYNRPNTIHRTKLQPQKTGTTLLRSRVPQIAKTTRPTTMRVRHSAKPAATTKRNTSTRITTQTTRSKLTHRLIKLPQSMRVATKLFLKKHIVSRIAAAKRIFTHAQTKPRQSLNKATPRTTARLHQKIRSDLRRIIRAAAIFRRRNLKQSPTLKNPQKSRTIELARRLMLLRTAELLLSQIFFAYLLKRRRLNKQKIKKKLLTLNLSEDVQDEPKDIRSA